jgi:protein involved in polysaccharide export with SLBB domain
MKEPMNINDDAKSVCLLFALLQFGLVSVPGADTTFPDLALPTEFSSPTNRTISAAGYVPDNTYRLRPGDQLSFQILEDRDPAKSLVVTDSGELDVPYIGRYAAKDKTCKQLVGELKPLLEQEYYFRASVILALDQASKDLGFVYVIGQVKNQGPIKITAGETLTAGKAILQAGGFGDFANKKSVKVVRGNPGPGGEKQSFDLNMQDILERGMIERDLEVHPDDFVIVPARAVNF